MVRKLTIDQHIRPARDGQRLDGTVVFDWRWTVKTSCIVLLAFLGALFVSSGPADAFGYGYRANEPVRVDRCYRGFAYDYAVPFYILGTRDRYYRNGCCCERSAKKSYAFKSRKPIPLK